MLSQKVGLWEPATSCGCPESPPFWTGSLFPTTAKCLLVACCSQEVFPVSPPMATVTLFSAVTSGETTAMGGGWAQPTRARGMSAASNEKTIKNRFIVGRPPTCPCASKRADNELTPPPDRVQLMGHWEPQALSYPGGHTMILPQWDSEVSRIDGRHCRRACRQHPAAGSFHRKGAARPEWREHHSEGESSE
jgi:hypothetical protein